MIEIIRTSDADFPRKIAAIVRRGETIPPEIEAGVATIIKDVRTTGVSAVIRYTEQFDGVLLTPETMEIAPADMKKSADTLPKEARDIISAAADRIRSFHEKQKFEGFEYTDALGNRLGQIVRPVKRAGVYVPGGRAPYPSTLLMNVIPARIAGVEEIVAVHPTPDGMLNPAVMAAALEAGVDRMFRIGGAQAVAALAFGVDPVPRADVIVGPGNIFVATAKKQLFGIVNIDMIAGPSEILIIADGTGNPAWAAADLLSQAEHDPLAAAILITTDESFAHRVAEELSSQLAALEREKIARQSLASYGALIVAGDLIEAAAVSNDIAPEHLELMVEDPDDLLKHITAAGSIFLGHHTPETVGDYAAGPNHVLPTGGTARFSSPLGVYDFVTRMSVIEMSEKGVNAVGRISRDFARLEGLSAHARAVELRIKKDSTE
ncbi:MAG: histidinol dehydrogenase [Deltaproteobacteria bacterium]|nr:histidinol dehydrogenase [Candidatus Zymogenaceae bacterium]